MAVRDIEEMEDRFAGPYSRVRPSVAWPLAMQVHPLAALARSQLQAGPVKGASVAILNSGGGRKNQLTKDARDPQGHMVALASEAADSRWTMSWD